MYWKDYLLFLPAILACMGFSIYASVKVRSSFTKYNKVRSRSGLNGYQTATRLLNMGGVQDISVGSVRGELTDHYHPKKKVVNLSESTYGSNSVAAVAVAAHEIGHVMQNRDGYLPYRIRTAIVPAVNIGSFLAMPLVLLGVCLELFVQLANPDTGFYVAMVGVVLYGLSFLFTLVTLPVELNASRRAKAMLIDAGVLSEDEIPAATKVLSAAAMTYLASMLTSLVHFLRFLFHVLAIFGKRNR